MTLAGPAFKFGDNISTDDIVPGRLIPLRGNLPELAKHVFEDLDPTFVSRIRSGGFVVGGRNFGQGSSREHAAIVLRMVGANAVLARSAARIFFRNCINVGLPIVICDTEAIAEGDQLEVDLEGGRVRDLTSGAELTFGRIPETMVRILNEGGLAAYVRKYGDLPATGGC